MKTKIFIILCGLFMLSSQLSKAHSVLQCDGSGGCYYYTWHYSDAGNIIVDGREFVGSGCAGTWAVALDHVIPAGPATHPEASPNAYTYLANVVSDIGTPTAEQSAVFISGMTNNPPTTNWVKPYDLSAAAYNFIYAGLPYYDIFYVYTSTNISTGSKMLNIYSDLDNKTCLVKYKNVMGAVVASENVIVSKGSNYKALTVPSSLPSGYYTLQVISPSSEVTIGMNK